MLGEDSPAERIDLAECDGSHPGSFEAEAETADPAEKIEDIHLFPCPDRVMPLPYQRRNSSCICAISSCKASISCSWLSVSLVQAFAVSS